MTRRSSPNLTEQLAAALLQVEDCPELYEHAKAMTAHQIVSLFHRDHHPVRVFDQESLAAAGIRYINHPCNLTWRLIATHRKKTAEVDAPAIAKTRRIKKSARTCTCHPDDRPPVPCPKRYAYSECVAAAQRRDSGRIPSRPFDSRYTRGMDGKVRPRKRGAKG